MMINLDYHPQIYIPVPAAHPNHVYSSLSFTFLILLAGNSNQDPINYLISKDSTIDQNYC